VITTTLLWKILIKAQHLIFSKLLLVWKHRKNVFFIGACVNTELIYVSLKHLYRNFCNTHLSHAHNIGMTNGFSPFRALGSYCASLRQLGPHWCGTNFLGRRRDAFICIYWNKTQSILTFQAGGFPSPALASQGTSFIYDIVFQHPAALMYHSIHSLMFLIQLKKYSQSRLNLK
jgi:hypothetical protein